MDVVVLLAKEDLEVDACVNAVTKVSCVEVEVLLWFSLLDAELAALGEVKAPKNSKTELDEIGGTESEKKKEKVARSICYLRWLVIETCEPIQLNRDSRVHALEFERHWSKA